MIRAFDKTDNHALRIVGDDLEALIKEISAWLDPLFALDADKARDLFRKQKYYSVLPFESKFKYKIIFYYDPEYVVSDNDYRRLKETDLYLMYYPRFKSK